MAKNLEDFSDDELASMTPEQFAAAAGNAEPIPAEEPGPDDDDAEPTPAPVEANPAEPNPTPAEDDDEEPAPAAKVEPANGAEAGKGGKATDAEGAPANTKEPKAGDTKPAEVDGKATETKNAPVVPNYEDEYKKLLAPFKANGRDIQVENVDDARQLMQMGANYSKKMAALKPQLAILRMLDNAKLDQQSLSFLIDVHRKDPAAINKLVKDSGIDPMDLSAEKAAGYVQSNHMPSESEVNLETVLTELEGSQGYAQTLQVANGFDAKSKQILAENPEVLKAINQHIELGAYELTVAEVERRRMLGKLPGLSDLEAYRQVGNEMQASGKFAHLGAGQPVQSQQTPVVTAAVTPNPRKAEDESKRNAARRAVAPVKAAPATGKTLDPDFNPLSLSDEDFAKLGGKF